MPSINTRVPSSFFTLYLFSPGRRLFAMRETRKEAHALGLDVLVAALDEAIAFEEALIEQERQWERARSGVDASTEAVAIDRQIDRLLGALANILGSHADAGDAQAEELIKALYPEGIRALTHRAFIDQHGATAHILNTLDGHPATAALALGGILSKLSTHNTALGTILGERRPQAPLFADLREARAGGQNNLARVVAMVLARFHSDTELDLQRRADLLGPILVQQEAIADQRRGRQVPTADPEVTESDPTSTPTDPASPPAPTDPELG